MNTEKLIKETKAVMIGTLVLGLVLLAAGIGFDLLDIHIINNNKAIVGLSLIPLSIAFVSYLKLRRIRKSPQKMRETLVNESDERLVSLRNEVDAKAFRITQGALFFAYMGYTLMGPEDIFESPGWWILLGLLVVSFLSQGVIHASALKKESSEESEE